MSPTADSTNVSAANTMSALPSRPPLKTMTLPLPNDRAVAQGRNTVANASPTAGNRFQRLRHPFRCRDRQRFSTERELGPDRYQPDTIVTAASPSLAAGGSGAASGRLRHDRAFRFLDLGEVLQQRDGSLG